VTQTATPPTTAATPTPRFDQRGHRGARLRLAAGTLTLVGATVYAMIRLLMLKSDPTATRADILLTLLAILSVGAAGVWVSMAARQAFGAWEIWSDEGGLELRREHERIRLDGDGVERVVPRPSTLLPTLTEVRLHDLDKPIFAIGADAGLANAQAAARAASRSTQPAA
jgi:hypothetical protein